MKTDVRNTSVQAYKGLRHESTQAERIFEAIEDMGCATIRMVAKKLNMEISTVSARINKLVKEDRLEESHRDQDPFTKVRSIYWQPVKEQTVLCWGD